MGLIGCAKNHPFLGCCIEELPDHAKHRDILSRTGPYFFTRCAEKYLPQCQDISIFFPVSYFYPWPDKHRKKNARSEIEEWIRDETFAIHHWHVSWSEPKKSKKPKK